MRRSRWAVLVLACLAARAASPQDEGKRDEFGASTGVHLGGGAGFGALVGPAAMGELLYGFGADVRDDGDRVRGVVGVLAQVQAGANAGKLSLGVGGRARVESEDWKGMVALNLKLSLARTWHEAYGSRRTYLGPEIDLCVKHVAFGFGTLFRVSGEGSHVVFSWGIGVRL